MSLADFVSTEASPAARGFALGSAANIAYEVDEETRRRRFETIGLELVESVDCESSGLTGLEAYILQFDGDLLIAIRGSQELLDFVTDLDMTKTSIGGVLVHRGFARSAQRLLDGFRTWRMSFGAVGRVWITGHSLGGAVAQIVGYLLNEDGEQVAGVTTFGSPRVGGRFLWRDKGARSGFSQRCERWVNRRDVVPRLPVIGLRPQNWLWIHAGRQHLIDVEARRILFDDGSKLWPSRLIEGIGDHSMSGFSIGDESGYLRNMLVSMPPIDRAAIRRASEVRLRAAIAGYSRETNCSNIKRLGQVVPVGLLERSLGIAALAYL